jgi:hypothetical protein
MTPAGLLRRNVLPAVLLLVAFGAVGCGQQAGADGPGGSAKASPDDSATREWVLRLESLSGEDGETKQATYLTITPGSGAASVATMPRLQVAEASGDERVLLVDAHQQYALADSRPSQADRARGRVAVVDLGTGESRTVDVRRATGDPKLSADWVSFDAKEPGLLRVVDGLTVWTLGVDGGNPVKEGVLPSRPGWIYGGGFNKNTGTPYIEDTGSFATLPKGNGVMDARPVRREGGRLMQTDNGYFRGLPDPKCELTTGYQDSTGESWAFCVEGRRVVVKRLLAGGTTWQDYGKPTGSVVPRSAEPVFVLPRYQALQ